MQYTVAIATQFVDICQNKITSILVARQRTLPVLNLLSIALLQNIANTLFATTGVIIGCPLLYCFRFEMILNSHLLSQKCRQRERTSLRDGVMFRINSTLMIIRRQRLYAMKPEGSLYIQCIKFQSKVPNPVKRYYTNSQGFFTDPHISASMNVLFSLITVTADTTDRNSCMTKHIMPYILNS